jgi:sugar (pentulose or hexulose) kinase
MTGWLHHLPILPVAVPLMLGAAMLARSAVRRQPLDAVAREMARFAEVIEPDPVAGAIYDDTYPLFTDIYRRMRESFEGLARLRRQT